MKAFFLVFPASIALWVSGCASSASSSPGSPASAARVQPLADQPTFASPEDAVAALYRASASKDLKEMAHIVGLPEQDVLSGDAEKDSAQAERFAKAHDQRVKIVREGDARARAFIGEDNYPLASSLVRNGDRWSFDSAGGKSELLARVIGENELATIGVCRAYVQAQYEYYSEDRNGDDVLQYAQKLASTRGQHDGLYWHTEGDGPESPLGSLIAEARAEGYLSGSAQKLDAPKPYHGYLFKILTAQGENAPGWAYSYIINGRMIAGFALVAYPAKWNHSGIMTFLVGANGKVYHCNLGEKTGEVAGAMTEYNPDASWVLVRD